MNWINLTSQEQVETIKNSTGYSVIFKHSTRCSISLMAKRGFESNWEVIPPTTPLYFLDLLNYREISNSIAEEFNVYHESPQALLIYNGECILDLSHSDISSEEIADSIKI